MSTDDICYDPRQAQGYRGEDDMNSASEIESLRAQLASAKKALEQMRGRIDRRQNAFINRASSIYQGVHIAEELAAIGILSDEVLKAIEGKP